MQNAVFGFVASFQDDKTCHSKVFAGVAVGLALHRTISYLRRSQRQSELQKQAEKKRMIRDQARDAFIIEAKKYGSSPDAATHEHAVAVCDMTAQELAEKFQASLSNESSVEDTMRVLALRAAGAGRTLGSNAEELFSEAMEIAKSLDQEPVVQRQSKPLFGVGVSIKDCINVRGCDSTCGLAAKTFQPAQEDSVIVEMLRDAGAIPFVRGNIPQCLMIPESSNAIWGTALNPWNIARTPGGSSGGEAALVACGAAPIAIGTDIGGSIRIPSNCCGVYGFKPTPERISNLGIPAPRPKGENGQRGIVASPGPIARCVADLVSVMRVWWQPYATNKMFQRDPYIPPVEFNESSFSGTAKKTLRIGYYTDDAYCESAPSFKRAVLQAKAALEQAGHTVVPFEVPSATEYPDIMFQVLSADGNMQGFMDGCEGEALLDDYKDMYRYATIPNAVRPLLATLLRWLGQPRASKIVRAAGKKTAYQYWQSVAQLNRYRRAFVAKMNADGIDAILLPGGTLPAVPHHASKKIMPCMSMTYLYNILHFPAGTVPITQVQPGETTYSSRYTDKLAKDMAATLHGAEGLPVCVQVAARPFDDELCLRVMAEVESGIAYDTKPSAHKFNGGSTDLETALTV
eukprot:m.641157 g.641157  ORF g.641157 m.641157 type:complete len:630 (-) comp22626_c0_seq13:1303-3192(-)